MTRFRPFTGVATTVLAGLVMYAGCATPKPQAATVSAKPDAQMAKGDWLGALKTNGGELHLAVHLQVGGGRLSGTMDSLDQGANGLLLANVRGEGGALTFDVPAIGGRYAGAWTAAKGGYTGEWTQPSVKLPLDLMRGQVAARPVVSGLDGDWDGRLQTGTVERPRLAFHVRTTAAGTLATVESPDQGSGALPFSAVSRTGPAVSFTAAAIRADFHGQLSADGKTLTGQWSQGGRAVPLIMIRRAPGAPSPASAALNRPQTPKRPYPYREVEVGYDNLVGDNHLAGTLTLPRGRGPFPAALLITGSGLQDRDETLLGHKPFLVLADYLTRRGIAVLRVDDRTMGGSTGDVIHATSADFATDVQAGVVYLKARPEIDPRKIGLIGHSEGGMIAPMVAARDPSVAWMVLMAGPGLPGDQIILAQQRLIAISMGTPPDQVAKASAMEAQLVDAVEKAPNAERARESAKAILAEGGVTGAVGDANAARVSSDWFRYFLRYDPAPALRRVKAPVLAMDGSLDLQVPPKENLAAIKAALAANHDATTVELPGLNHLFQTAKTGALSEYRQIEETISPWALKTIGDWVVAHTR